MESIIEEALRYAGKEQVCRESTDADDVFEEFGMPQIKVIGCGGAGNNTINRLYRIGVAGAEIIALNTDKQHLSIVNADKKILIGGSITRGLGAGGYPEIGRRAAELARGTLEEALKGADLVFITAGMGGGTGTGSAPIVAEIAKKQGAIVVGMVSSPFMVERARLIKAEEGLETLRRAADTVIVLDNNRLLAYVPNLPLEQAFSVMDQLIADTVKGISETITQPSLINLDFADVKTIMSSGGVAVMVVGETKGQGRAEAVVSNALANPLLDVDYRGATGALVHISGGTDLTLGEAEEITRSITYELDPRANVIWGARVNKEFDGKVRVMAIMTGVQSAQVLGPRNANASDAVFGRYTPKQEKTIIDVIR
ncbi:MAG: cell division protein FtsZ [Methanosarcinales archaeon Met12]|nr:MAG: cell division protein FtsZ [Methanosarcinales archaeon Met12]